MRNQLPAPALAAISERVSSSNLRPGGRSELERAQGRHQFYSAILEANIAVRHELMRARLLAC